MIVARSFLTYSRSESRDKVSEQQSVRSVPMAAIQCSVRGPSDPQAGDA